MTKYVNLFGGPGVGKSTTAAILFGEMKKLGMNVELVTEVAKDFVWEGRMGTLDIQPYVTMKQYRNLFRLKGKVDYVITDAPILLGCVYSDRFNPDMPATYKSFIVDLHHQMLNPSINICLLREFEYKEEGRYQTEEVAKQIDLEIDAMLSKAGATRVYLSPINISGMIKFIQEN